jgi:hypothetical protein
MADKTIQMTQRNTANTGWDNLNPKTSANLVNIIDTGGLFTATDVEGALSELFTNANNGKTAIANAVNAKGISASGVDTFSVLATKIATTSLVNTADATVVASEMISGKTGYKNGAKITGTMKKHTTSENRITVALVIDGNYTGSVYAKPEAGNFDGVDSFVQLSEPNHVASNYLAGKTYFGLAGTAPNVTNSASTPSGGYDGDYWVQP